MNQKTLLLLIFLTLIFSFDIPLDLPVDHLAQMREAMFSHLDPSEHHLYSSSNPYLSPYIQEKVLSLHSNINSYQKRNTHSLDDDHIEKSMGGKWKREDTKSKKKKDFDNSRNDEFDEAHNFNSLPYSKNKNHRKLIAKDYLDIIWGRNQYFYGFVIKTLEERWGAQNKTKNEISEFWAELGNLGLRIEDQGGKWVFGVSKEEEIMDQIDGYESTKVEVWRPYLGRVE